MKKIITVAMGLMMIFGLAACGKAEEPKPEVSTAGQNEFTGVLEEKKDFMIIVDSIDGKNAYVFSLPEEGLEISSSTGDKVTVTYTGDMTDIDSQLVATDVKPAK